MTVAWVTKSTAAAALIGAGLLVASGPAEAATSVWVRDGNGGGSVFNGNGVAGRPASSRS